jgi:BON domain-containing protein
VSGGVVTLSGSVDSYAKRLAAQTAAHRVAGVLDVANDLQVQIPSESARTDTEIALASALPPVFGRAQMTGQAPLHNRERIYT